jgi:hypothetical protein
MSLAKPLRIAHVPVLLNKAARDRHEPSVPPQIQHRRAGKILNICNLTLKTLMYAQNNQNDIIVIINYDLDVNI